jgi:hypothetical protein
MGQRRKHPRISLGIENRPLLFISDENRRRIPLTALNLSLGGIGFLCTHQFDVEEEYDVTLFFPETGSVHGRGTIKFIQELWGIHGYGMKLDMDDRNHDVMERYIDMISHGF